MNAATEDISASARPAVPPSLARAFGGVWRLTLPRFLTPRHWLAVAGMLTALGLIAYAFLDGGHDRKRYLEWSVGFYITFLVPLVSFIVTAGAFRDEMQPATTDYVLTRPVPRPAFVAFKFLAHVALLQLELLLSFTVIVGLGWYFGVPDLAPALPLLLLSQGFLVLAFSAFGLLCGILTSRYVVLGLFYAVIVELGVGQIPTQLSRFSMTHQVRTLLQPLYAARVDETSALAAFGLLVAFSIGCLLAGAAVFSLRELSDRAES